MAKNITLDTRVVEAMLGIIHQQNEPGREIHILVAAVETGAPPTVVSSIHPDQLPGILQFLVDNHKNADVVAHDMETGESGTLN